LRPANGPAIVAMIDRPSMPISKGALSLIKVFMRFMSILMFPRFGLKAAGILNPACAAEQKTERIIEHRLLKN
jgi:hypothetical protein